MKGSLLALGVVFFAASGAGAGQSTSETGENEGDVLGEAEALEATAQMLAESEEIGFALAMDVLVHQETMDLLQEKIHDLDPEAYGGAVHDRLPSIGTRIFVKGEIPAEAITLVNSAENVSIESVHVSLQDVTAASEFTAQILRNIGFEDIAVGADLRTHSIDVEVASAELDGLSLTVEELESKFVGLDLPISLTAVDGPVSVPTAGAYGGGQLAYGTANRCTAGFTVKTSGGTTGLLTAAHCSTMNKYKTTGGGTYNLYYQGAALSSLGDAEWHTTSGTEYGRFHHNNTSTTDVSGLKNHIYMDVGDYVCRYGRKTGSGGCQDIINLSVSAGGYSSMVRVDSTSDQPGDSGGPWYSGTTAWGIHHGHFNSNHDGIFTAVSIVDGNLGVSLKTD